MRTVAQIQSIRYLHEVEGWSMRRIARELHMSRETVRRCLDRSDGTQEPRYTRCKPVCHPKMGPYEEIVDAWLASDQHAPGKQRHTARRIFQRLREEYGADLAESTVRAFVAARRRELTPKNEAFLHLAFPPAQSAQVDWGEAFVKMGGRSVKVYMFCMRLCYSTAAFVMLFPTARMECFLEGHLRALSFFGGVPQRIIYDNLHSAVTRILHGRERVLNGRFQTLAAHYLFEPVFANPRSGWEKGLVEDLVGTARRTFLVPVPEVQNLTEANEQLMQRLLLWRQHIPAFHDGRTVGALWDEERSQLRPLPPATYRASTSNSARVSKFATVQYQRVLYSVPAQHVGRTLRLEAFHDHIEVYHGHVRVAMHPIYKRGSAPVLELEHYLDVLLRKPGAVRHARVVSDLGTLVTSYRDAFLEARPQAYREFVQILLLSRRATLPAVLSAIAVAHQERIYDVERVSALLDAGFGLSDRPCQMATGPSVEQTPPQAYDTLLMGVLA